MEKIFGRDNNVYVKREKIDEGSQASVFKYLRLKDSTEFAVKIYYKDRS